MNGNPYYGSSGSGSYYNPYAKEANQPGGAVPNGDIHQGSSNVGAPAVSFPGSNGKGRCKERSKRDSKRSLFAEGLDSPALGVEKRGRSRRTHRRRLTNHLTN